MTSSDILFGKASDFVIHTPDCVQKITASLKNKSDKHHISRTLRLCFYLLARIETGTLHFVAPDKSIYTFKGQRPGPQGTVIIHRERAIRRFFVKGNLGFCESYLEGDWSSPDIAAFFEVILHNGPQMKSTLLGKPWVRFLNRCLHKARPNSLKGSRRNIYAHYDIGNDFYAQWLDPSMTYSAALFDRSPELTLEEAQRRKYEALAHALHIENGMRVLEIGCGWGGFAEYLAQNYQCHLTAITISHEQYEYAKNRIVRAGLNDKVSVHFQDYRHITGRFDRIASIEMFEAVGERYWDIYFQKINEYLTDSGRAVIQTITIDDALFDAYRKKADFIQKYIFPGGMLPCQRALEKHASRAGLSSHDPLKFGTDYARTLRLWNENFQAKWSEIKNQGFDERFKRLWELYLCYCESGFRAGTTDVIQLPLTKK